MQYSGVLKVTNVLLSIIFLKIAFWGTPPPPPPPPYLKWKKEHIDDCVANYSGSAPGMEQEGAKRIFGRPEENRGLKYTHFYGDGDSKSFKVVENIYPDKKSDNIRV